MRARVSLGLALLLLAVKPALAEDVAIIHLVFTNDIHGYVDPRGATFMNPNFPPPLGGGASAARYLKELRASIEGDPNQAVLLVDAGDTWQGSPVGTITEGRVMADYFNELGYDAVTVGNHEFDKGKDVAISLSEGIEPQFICANIYDENDKLVDWIQPYRIVEKAGLRIGIIGAATPGTVDMAFEENVEGLHFGDIIPAVEKQRDILLNEELCDFVMLVVHEGLPFDAEEEWKELLARRSDVAQMKAKVHGAMDLAHLVENVPVIVGGHTHRGYREPWIDPYTHNMVFETFGNGSSVGHAILRVDRETGLILGYDTPRRDGVLVTLFEDEWWPEAKMAERLAPHIEEANEGLSEVVGRTTVELARRGKSNSVMGNFVTDAMRDAFKADWAFSNTGGLRTDLSRGNITAGDLLRLLPFGNSLVVVEMEGRMICQILDRKASRRSSGLFQSGAKVVVDPDAPEYRRLLEVEIAGGPIDPDRLYKVVTVDYLMEGNSGLDFLAQIPPDRAQYTQLLTRDALSRYLQRNSPVSPRVDDRFREERDGQVAPYLQTWVVQ